MMTNVPNLLKQELAELASEDMRIDGRGRFERQDVTLEVDCLYNAEGSAKVTWGNYRLCWCKFEMRTPWLIDLLKVR